MRTGRLLVPEAIQTSAMDCGPACLKSLLGGFRISVSYDRLREACQTDLDGTSIDTIEAVAQEFGLDAKQIVVPVDHLILPEAQTLPAIVVVRLPNHFTHFVIVWGQYGRWLQVMDPVVGRHWSVTKEFLNKVHIHPLPVRAQDWRDWAGSEEFVGALRRRMRQLTVSESRASRILDAAIAVSHWRAMAALDAIVRMMNPMVQSGSLRGDRTAGRVLERFFERATAAGNPFQVIPPVYWSVVPARGYTEQKPQLVFRGGVLLRVRGKRRDSQPSSRRCSEPAMTGRGNLKETLRQTVKPVKRIVDLLRMDGLLAPAILAGAFGLSSLALLVEALLFRDFLDFTGVLAVPQQRLAAAGMLLGFFIVMLILDVSIATGIIRFGRKLEIRVRALLFHALPRVPDRYFGSRLISDMAARCHAIHEIRLLPHLGGQFIRFVSELVLTTLGIIWLDPQTASLAVTSMLLAVVLPFAAQPFLLERDLRFRTHAGSLSRFYFDALRGLMPISTHCAGKAVQREHEGLLRTWLEAGLSLQRGATLFQGFTLLTSFGLTVWLLLSHLLRASDSAVALLLVYWAMRIPALGRDLAQLVWQYPRLHNVARRVFEPLDVVREKTDRVDSVNRSEAFTAVRARRSNEAVSLLFKEVSVRATGHTILQEFSLRVDAGSHICIVGPSGAGKSTLIGLLLGWHRPSTGTIEVDGLPLDDVVLESLRRDIAWVEPNVQLWNRSLAENLQYGLESGSRLPPIGGVIEEADLWGLLTSLPDGLQSRLGEGGALVSGGEGQRVRLGRAMLRPSSRLVVLDEPFTALDRGARRSLLMRARSKWNRDTVLCVPHDVSDSTDFERVIVMEEGRIIEDGSPEELLRRSESRYRKLLEADRAVRGQVWANPSWRTLRLENGKLTETTYLRDDDQHSRDMLAHSTAERDPYVFGGTGWASSKAS